MSEKEGLTARRAKLSPAKKDLLERRLQGKLPHGSSTDGSKPGSIPRRSQPGPAPLSFAQERMWFLDQLEPGNPAYNRPVYLRLMGGLNVAVLEKSLNEIVDRHEALRTVFQATDGRPAQVVTPTLTLSLPVVDLHNLPEAEREEEVRRLTTEEAQRPFDLAQGPFLKAALLKLGEEEHLLLLFMHHIVFDGWSVGVLHRELTALYEAFSTGEPSPLPELPIQYADFAHWQRGWMDGDILQEGLAYWRQGLDGAPAVLELPTDRPRPAVQTSRGASQSMTLPKTLSKSLKVLSQGEGVTIFMTLLAAFGTLLHRYTGQDDIVVGSPIAGRNRAEMEGLIGVFINTLVLRTDFSGNPTFRELLGRVRETALGAYAHQNLPFEKLVEELKPERNLSHTPLFQVMFNYEDFPDKFTETQGLRIDEFGFDNKVALFDLTLEIVSKDEELSCIFEYNTDLFEEATIERMLGNYETILGGIVAAPEQRLSHLPLLTERERHQLLVEWNNTYTEYHRNSCVHELFEAQVERTPEAVALIFEDLQLTYQELNARANQLAHYLRSLGVGSETLVGIFMERSLEMIVGVLGVLKAGGAYVPLDPTYPKERIAFMLEDAQVSLLLTQERMVEALPQHSAHLVRLDTDWEVIAQESRENPASNINTDNLAYVIYTSGSTGKPKGVQIPHSALTNFLDSMCREPGMTSQNTLLAVTTLSFDIAALELFLPIIVGARVVVVSREVASNGKLLSDEIANSGAALMQATPATWRLLLESGWPGRDQLKVLCGGEALSWELANQLLERGVSLWNMYGPTETTIWSSVHRVESEDKVISIGRPIANTQIYILDQHLQPVPVGVAGELHIGGDGLARGYLNRPELTVEKFIANPFSNESGGRLYKTGDLTRYLPDGKIECLGRIDHQVKIRGFRIELGEIEAVLSGHGSVGEAVALVREDEPGDKRLVAYVVPSWEQAPTTGELRRYLKEKLPDYMVPSVFMMLDWLPLTPNGKVDRRVLPAPDSARTEVEETFVAPRDELEIRLTKVWEKVLGVRPIGVRDNFFDLGGHSLLAVRLFTQIEKTLERNIPLSTLFQSPTVEQLAEVLRDEAGSSRRTSIVEIQSGSSKPPFFCVHACNGPVLFYRDLARHLGSDQPVYGLQAAGLDGDGEPPSSFEEIAAHYIKEMQTIQSEGPYLLGGLGLGGNLSFEIAQQLTAQGQKVSLLAILCSRPLLPSESSRKSSGHYVHRLIYYLKNGQLIELLLNYILNKVRKVRRRIRRTVQWLSSPQARRIQHVNNVLSRAQEKYAAEIYPGRITLFWGNRQNKEWPSRWSRLAGGGLDFNEVPGIHTTIVKEPDVQVLAEKLRASLDEVQADGKF